MLPFLSPPHLFATRRTPNAAGREGSALDNQKSDLSPGTRLQFPFFHLDLTSQGALHPLQLLPALRSLDEEGAPEAQRNPARKSNFLAITNAGISVISAFLILLTSNKQALAEVAISIQTIDRATNQATVSVKEPNNDPNHS